MPTRRRFETLPLFEPSGAIQSATEPRRLSRGLSITSGDCSLRQGMPDMCFWTSIGHQNRILDSFDSQRKLGISKLTLSPKLIRFPSPQVPHRSFRPKHRIVGQRNGHLQVLRAGKSIVLILSFLPPEPRLPVQRQQSIQLCYVCVPPWAHAHTYARETYLGKCSNRFVALHICLAMCGSCWLDDNISG